MAGIAQDGVGQRVVFGVRGDQYDALGSLLLRQHHMVVRHCAGIGKGKALAEDAIVVTDPVAAPNRHEVAIRSCTDRVEIIRKLVAGRRRVNLELLPLRQSTLVESAAEHPPAVPVGRTALPPEDDEAAVLVYGDCGIHQLVG